MPGPINIADRPYFRAALEIRRFAIGDYQIGRIVGKPVIHFSHPVLNDARQVKAIVYVAMDLSWLNNFSARAHLPPGSSVTVVNHNSTILAHHPEPEKWVGKNMEESPVIKTILSQREGMIEAKGEDGVQRSYAFTPFGGTGQAGNIFVSMGIPAQVAFAQVDQMLNRNLVVLVLIAFLALLAVWVGGDLLILRRLRPLVKTAKRLAASDLSAHTKTGCGDGELNQLASTFDEMAESLERREAERKLAEEDRRKNEDEARRLAEENAIMAEIGRIIGSTLSIEEVYPLFAKEVNKLIPFDRISINLFHPEEGTVVVAYVSGLDIRGRRLGDSFPLKDSFTEKMRLDRVSLLNQPETIEELEGEFPKFIPLFQAGLRSMIAVPLVSRDAVIGALHLQSTKCKAYIDRDLKLAERIASQIAGAIANAHLFRERIRAEKEMADLQEQLRQSQKLEAVGRLAGGIAHDFNNFLTVMRGRSQLALMELKEGDPLRESFEAIDNATNKSASLVRQLLAFSRRQVMQMIVLDLNTLIRDMEEMLRRLIGEDIKLLTVLTDDLGKVKADPGQIEQVLLNLAVNARDAMPQGGKLTIETVNVELDEAYAHSHVAVKPGPYVMLSVSDTGVGMTSEVRKQVFEPFFTTKERGKGTGLGLATVYGIVKQSGGNIWVYSEPGQGATFKVYLPRVEEALTEEKEKEPPNLFRGVGVMLVVEDAEEVRKVVLEVLRNQGYSVLEAADEKDALLICQQYKDTIHLMVSDVFLPGVNGPALARRLVALHPEMKLLYMSGYTENAIVHHGVLDKGVNCIQKPFTMEGLAKKVREVLDSKFQP